MDYLDRIPDKDDVNEKQSYVDYLYKSAKAIIKNGTFYGFPVDLDNDKEVIACLFCMYLNENSLRKDFQTEVEFIRNV